MKTLRSVLLLVACALPCAAQGGTQSPEGASVPELNPAAWEEFTSAEGGFAVRMPAKPVESHRPLPPPNENVVAHSFIASTAAEYGVVYADYPWPVEGTERVGPLFEGVLKMGAQGVGGRVLEQKEQEYAGHPGRVSRVEFDGGYHLRTVAFVVKNRLYMVTASTYGTKAPTPEFARLYERAADLYLSSFRLTSEGAPPATETVEGEVDRMIRRLREKGGDGGLVIGDRGGKDDAAGTPSHAGAIDVRVLEKPEPVYPPIAKAARAQGAVVVQVLVDEEGRVLAAQALSGHPLLQAAAVKAARSLRLSPTLLGGKPVKLAGTVTYNFVLK